MIRSHGYAALERGGDLVAFDFERGSMGVFDILVDIRFCGVCHSDLHAVDNDWGFHSYPLVPGHEIVGMVTDTGSHVTRFQIGDWVGIGSIIDSCRTCSPCEAGLEIYCDEGATPSFGGADRSGQMTFGGFSNKYVVSESYAVRIPSELDPARAAPLLCAGITTFSPFNKAQLKSGDRVGIVGLGGLGHLAIKWARAFGADVVVFTTSPDKAADALALGACEVIISSDPEQMAHQTKRFNFIMDTVSAPHDVSGYLDFLKLDGVLFLTGMPAQAAAISPMQLALGRRVVTSSMTGGIAETQEMLEFAARHDIAADVEVLPIAQLNTVFDRLRRNDVRFRFVVEMAALKGGTA